MMATVHNSHAISPFTLRRDSGTAQALPKALGLVLTSPHGEDHRARFRPDGRAQPQHPFWTWKRHRQNARPLGARMAIALRCHDRLPAQPSDRGMSGPGTPDPALHSDPVTGQGRLVSTCALRIEKADPPEGARPAFAPLRSPVPAAPRHLRWKVGR